MIYSGAAMIAASTADLRFTPSRAARRLSLADASALMRTLWSSLKDRQTAERSAGVRASGLRARGNSVALAALARAVDNVGDVTDDISDGIVACECLVSILERGDFAGSADLHRIGVPFAAVGQDRADGSVEIGHAVLRYFVTCRGMSGNLRAPLNGQPFATLLNISHQIKEILTGDGACRVGNRSSAAQIVKIVSRGLELGAGHGGVSVRREINIRPNFYGNKRKTCGRMKIVGAA